MSKVTGWLNKLRGTGEPEIEDHGEYTRQIFNTPKGKYQVDFMNGKPQAVMTPDRKLITRSGEVDYNVK